MSPRQFNASDFCLSFQRNKRIYTSEEIMGMVDGSPQPFGSFYSLLITSVGDNGYEGEIMARMFKRKKGESLLTWLKVEQRRNEILERALSGVLFKMSFIDHATGKLLLELRMKDRRFSFMELPKGKTFHIRFQIMN